MKTVIISPHPDDEWVGCGCTILHKLDSKEKILAMMITKAPHSEPRLATAKELADKHGYSIAFLGEPEKNINKQRLALFLKKYIEPGDTVFIPSIDKHEDHRLISQVARDVLTKNKIYEYASYNNSLNPIRRIKNRLMLHTKKHIPASFRHGKEDHVFEYKLHIKNENIKKFYETPRGGDVLRRVR
jgi:LmbE family N-acetylglucosaminyl deacetylase